MKDKPTPMKTNVSIKANAIKLFVNTPSFISGLRATLWFIAPKTFPVATAPAAIGKVANPNIKHLAEFTNNTI